ncbi:MAG: EamA family transporter [Candidatus Moranbacteria bacterium]|nr:EamA family transporter [Candidatus Moranbacteria bacterium]
MTWLSIALTSYFLSALAVILDKFILGSKRISSPPVYSFYIGLLGLGALIFAPFGFSLPSGYQIVISLTSGALFTFGILALYFAIQKAEASRVATVIGAVTPLAVYLFSIVFFQEKLNSVQLIGAVLLIFGGLLISFDLPLQLGRKKFFSGFYYALLSGVVLAVAYLLFKVVYNEQAFFNGFIWTRFGSAVAIAGFFIIPKWRKDIIGSLRGFRRPTHTQYRTGALVIINKLIGGTSSILFNYALSLGSATLINALVSSQYVFVLILATLAATWHPKVFSEKLLFWDWAQKIGAIIIIAIGVALVSSLVSIESLLLKP